jgi:hypothetical protein
MALYVSVTKNALGGLYFELTNMDKEEFESSRGDYRNPVIDHCKVGNGLAGAIIYALWSMASFIPGGEHLKGVFEIMLFHTFGMGRSYEKSQGQGQLRLL